MFAIDRLKARFIIYYARLSAFIRAYKADTRKAIRPWRNNPYQMCRWVGLAFRRGLWFHGRNNLFRKSLVVVFTAIWGATFLGAAFGLASPPGTVFVMFTAFTFALIGASAGIEWNNVDPVTLTISHGADDESDQTIEFSSDDDGSDET